VHARDYGLVADALAAEHRAVAHGHPRRAAARQVERTALAIASAFANDSELFDPVEFMLHACDATRIEQLPLALRQQIAERFWVSAPRRRETGYRPEMPIDPGEIARWTEKSLIGMVIPQTTQAGNMAIGALNYYGDIHTLGELAAKSDEELQAIPRIGPGAMRVIREVLDLWRREQRARDEEAF
jgi:hypothetical protein